MKHGSFEGFSALDGRPFPFVQYAGGIDQNITPVTDHTPCCKVFDLDHPLLRGLVPDSLDDLVAEADISAEVVVVCHLLEICQDLRSGGIVCRPHGRCPRQLIVDRGNVAGASGIFVLEPRATDLRVLLVADEVDVEVAGRHLVGEIQSAGASADGDDLQTPGRTTGSLEHAVVLLGPGGRCGNWGSRCSLDIVAVGGESLGSAVFAVGSCRSLAARAVKVKLVYGGNAAGDVIGMLGAVGERCQGERGRLQRWRGNGHGEVGLVYSKCKDVLPHDRDKATLPFLCTACV